MSNITVIVLVGREEQHIKRCLEKLAALEPRQIFVVESQHGDRTHEIALSTSAPNINLVWHDWPGLQSRQFNWALKNLPIEGEWILRLDADEYLTPETVEKLKAELSHIPVEISGLNIELKRRFFGGEIKHATAGIKQVRLFRRGKAWYADTLMDEHLVVDGDVLDFDGAFYDDSLMPMSEWRMKHRGYAKREAQQAIESMKSGNWTDPRKAKYYRLPPYLRAFAYFAIRYFLKGGILDGYAGWMWNFWQGLWYRCLVDREIGRLKVEGGRLNNG